MLEYFHVFASTFFVYHIIIAELIKNNYKFPEINGQKLDKNCFLNRRFAFNYKIKNLRKIDTWKFAEKSVQNILAFQFLQDYKLYMEYLNL